MSWPTPGCVKLIDAMVQAEGGPEAFVRAVRISVPTCTDLFQARVIAANTIAHALWDMLVDDPTTGAYSTKMFVEFLGSRWAPVGTANDPKNLNANWVPNVISALRSKGVIV